MRPTRICLPCACNNVAQLLESDSTNIAWAHSISTSPESGLHSCPIRRSASLVPGLARGWASLLYSSHQGKRSSRPGISRLYHSHNRSQYTCKQIQNRCACRSTRKAERWPTGCTRSADASHAQPTIMCARLCHSEAVGAGTLPSAPACLQLSNPCGSPSPMHCTYQATCMHGMILSLV